MGYKFEKYSAGGGGGGIVDVAELPTENIKEGVLYRVPNGYSDIGVYLIDQLTCDSLESVAQEMNPDATVEYFVAEGQPDTPKTSDFSTLSNLYVYIWGNVPYVYGDVGNGETWVRLSELIASLGLDIDDKGYIETPNIVTDGNAVGLYVTYKIGGAIFTYLNGEWVEVGASEVPNIQPLTITENGTYTASGDVDGYSPITVEVAASGGGGATITTTIKDWGSYYRELTIKGVDFIGEGAYYGDTKIEKLTSDVKTIDHYAFYKATRLHTVDLSALEVTGYSAFQCCSSLKSVILRSTSAIPTVADSTLFGGTALTGVYVPRSMVDTYKATTNWTTWASKIRALEDYTVDGTITGELDPAKI